MRGDRFCLDDKIAEYEADNCGYTVIDDKILWVDIEYDLKTANKFYVYGNASGEGMYALETALDRSDLLLQYIPKGQLWHLLKQ